MARIPRVTRSATTDTSNFRPEAGETWAFLANITAGIEQVIRPAAMEQARIDGSNAVYRDEDGNLKVDEASVLGGPLSEAHNTTAHAAYLAKATTDARETLTELRRKHQADPAAFQEAANVYTKNALKNAPPILRANMQRSLGNEAVAMFDGLRTAQINRDNRKADKSTKLLLTQKGQDLVSMIQSGANFDDPRVVATLADMEQLSAFRANAPFINETEAEQSAFMRGVMGNAKTLSLMNDISGFLSSGEINEATRAQLRGRINDLDISPSQRQRLNGYLDGTVKQLEARSFVGNLTSDDFWAVMERNEKGSTKDGVPRGADGKPLSSASGRYGLLNATFLGTAKALRRRGEAGWAMGKTDAQLLAMKGDPAIERQVAEAHRAANQDALTKAGIPINRGNEYVVWVLGSGAGIKALRTDPATPAIDVVGAAAVKANKRLMQGKTIGHVVRWLQRKGGGPKTDDYAAMSREVTAIPDPETRDIARRELNEWRRGQALNEGEVADEYADRLSRGEPVTMAEIDNDPYLNGRDRRALRSAVQRRNEETRVRTEDRERVLGDDFLDPRSVKDRNVVDRFYRDELDGADPLSEKGMTLAGALLAEKEMLPKSMMGAIQGAIDSLDPERMVTAFTFAEAAQANFKGAFSPYGRDGERIAKHVAEFRHELQMGRTPEQAAETLAFRRTPEQIDKRRTRSPEAKKFADALTVDDLLDHFDTPGVPDATPGIGLAYEDVRIRPEWADAVAAASPAMRDQMMAMFRREANEAFVETGDAGAAKKRALAAVDRVFSVSSLSGPPRLMRLPPEEFYPAIEGSHDWLSSQLLEDARAMAGDDISLDNVYVVSDDMTQRDVAAGRYATYQLWYLKDGVVHLHEKRWHGDPEPARRDRDARARAAESELDEKSRATTEAFEEIRRDGSAIVRRAKELLDPLTDLSADEIDNLIFDLLGVERKD